MMLKRKMLMVTVCAVLLALTACAPENEKAANCEAFTVLVRIDYEDSAGFSALTPYQWGGLEITGCALLVPPGSNVFALITGNDTPTLSIYDAHVYDGESTLVGVYEDGMSADDWVEKALTEAGSSKAVTSMTIAKKDIAAGMLSDSGSVTYLSAYVSKDKAFMCMLQAPQAYYSENSGKLVGAEKDLANIAKSIANIPLKAK